MINPRLCRVFLHCSLIALIAASTLDVILMLGSIVLALADLMLVLAALMSLVLTATSIRSNALRVVVLELLIFVLVAADLVPMACVRG
jgi:hypothetical protein